MAFVFPEVPISRLRTGARKPSAPHKTEHRRPAERWVADCRPTNGTADVGQSQITSLCTPLLEALTPSPDKNARNAQPTSNAHPSLKDSAVKNVNIARALRGVGPTEGAAAASQRSSWSSSQLARKFKGVHDNLLDGKCVGDDTTLEYGDAVYHDDRSPDSAAASSPWLYDDLGGNGAGELYTASVRSSMRHSSVLNTESKSDPSLSTSRTECMERAKERRCALESGSLEGASCGSPSLALIPDPYTPEACAYFLRCGPAGSSEEGSRDQRPEEGCLVDYSSIERPDVVPAVLRDKSPVLPSFPLVTRTTIIGTIGSESVCTSAAGALQGGCTAEDKWEGAETSITSQMRKANTSLDRRYRNTTSAAMTGSCAIGGSPDVYQLFLNGVAPLQQEIRELQQNTETLRLLYEQEKLVRVRCKGRGKDLSWTRTVQAGNTIHFWRQKVIALRQFERRYLRAVKAYHQEIQLVPPSSEVEVKNCGVFPGTEAGAVAEARRCFLSSTEVLRAQQEHLRHLAKLLQLSWHLHSTLRHELQRLEQCEERWPHRTFATAGLDPEHFIASLPPRSTPYSSPHFPPCLSTASLSSMSSSDSLTLLTAQNLSPLSQSGSDGNARTDSPSAKCEEKVQNLGCAGLSDTPACRSESFSLASSSSPKLMKRKGVATSPIATTRLKYVVCSAVLGGEAATVNDFTVNASTLLSNAAKGGHASSWPPAGRERHVTFAIEPEFLDARPRLRSYGRTYELLEQICLDKQIIWNGLALLQKAIEERKEELAVLWAPWGGIADNILASLPSSAASTPRITASGDEDVGDGKSSYWDVHSSKSRRSAPSVSTAEGARSNERLGQGKAAPTECTTCLLM